MVVDSNNLIPRPTTWHFLRSFHSIPDLDLVDKQALKDAVYDYWNRMPVSDQRTTWVNLSTQKQLDFFLEITDRCPFLRRFEDAWPAEAWMRRRMEKGHALAYLAAKRRYIRSQPLRVYVRNRHHNREAGGTETGCSIHDSGEGNTQQNPASDAHVEQSTVVSRFLTSLSPNLSSLTDKFLQNGVRTEEDLVGLANMPEAYRTHFLQLDLLLPSFHAIAVRVGLAKQYQSRV